jgi:hypothetical protein
MTYGLTVLAPTSSGVFGSIFVAVALLILNGLNEITPQEKFLRVYLEM